MKSFFIALTLAACLTAAGIFSLCRLESASAGLLDENGRVIAALEKDDPRGAARHIALLSEAVEKYEPFFAALGNHEEIDKIEMTLAELRAYAEGGRTPDALAKARSLEFLFGHLPKNSRVLTENIL